jgi:hypothetical protein
MIKMIAVAIETKDKGGGYSWDDFADMINRLRKPFQMEIEGHVIRINDSNAAIMMKDLALEVIKDKILKLGEKGSREEASSTGNKKQKTGGGNSATVDTVKGADCFMSLDKSVSRDVRLNK